MITKEKPMFNLLKKIKVIGKMIQNSDGSTQAYYQKRMTALKGLFERIYEQEIKNSLFEVYDELCPDDEQQDILSYFCLKETDKSGINVMAYDMPGIEAEVNVRFFPLRIELDGLNIPFKEVVWKAA